MRLKVLEPFNKSLQLEPDTTVEAFSLLRADVYTVMEHIPTRLCDT